MKISYSPYCLRMQNSSRKREGMLVRIEENGHFGYGDCHPWVEYADAPLTEQIHTLTPLLERSLHFARIDLNARKQGVSLFEGLPLVKSYGLVSNPSDRLFLEQKLKLRPGDEEAFLAQADPQIEWRLDFNSSFTEQQCRAFLPRLKDFNIAYIEDPVPSRPGLWKKLQDTYGIPFAADFEKNPEGTLVIEKPAARSLTPDEKRRRIVTSYLDHPIGQLSALYTAATNPILSQETGGYLSHLIYEPNAFSAQFTIEEGCLVPPQGPGFGYQELLKHLTWYPL